MKRIQSILLLFLAFGWTSNVQAQVPVLNSLPGSAYVLYLDFDGHSDNSGFWDNWGFSNPIVTAPSTFTTTQMTEVFIRTSEDYRPFDINITTDESVYNAALASNRQRIVITPTSNFYTDSNGGAGGVAYIGFFGGGEIAGYVFTNFLGSSSRNAGEAVSHEAGHTLNLNHHSKYNADCSFNTQYHPGLGSGQTDWAPIMGSSYTGNISQWYKGATNQPTCTTTVQDDLAIISTANGFGYRPDDAGNTLATATTLALVGNPITKKGIITTTSDVDVYKITVSTAGIYTVFGAPSAYTTSTYSGANLDMKVWITNSAGTILGTGDPIDRLDATISSLTLLPGTYYIFIDGVGVSNYTDVGGTGSLDYGSVGEYTLSLTKSCTPVITSTTPGSRCGAGMVTLGAAAEGTLSWFAASSGGNALGTGTTFITPSISTNTPFYVSASAAACTTASARTAVLASVFPIPVVNAGNDQAANQNTGNLTLTGSPVGGTWGGPSVSASGIFNTAVNPGIYKLGYCSTSNGCKVCDSLLITINPSGTQVALPVITPGTGTYTSPQTVSISCSTAGAAIYYTTSGNTPVVGTGFTKLYTQPFLASENTTVRAIGVKSGLTNSATAVAYLTISNPSVVSTPVISPATGSFSGQQTVSITCGTVGASIYYTTNGNLPSSTLNSFTKLYTGVFTVNTSTTVRAMGIMTGKANSAVAVSYITITTVTPTVSTPVISPGTGTYPTSQSVSITCTTPSAAIYYTTSGNTPVVGTSFTKLYSVAIPVSTSTTIRAMATASGFLNSPVAVAYLTLSPGRPSAGSGFERFPSLADQSESTISVLPNPSQGIFQLFSEDEIQDGAVYNMNGQKILDVKSKQQSNTEIDLQKHPKGIYLLRIQMNNQVRNVRLVKE